MTDEQQGDPIDEEELPPAGNSDAKLYPKVEDAEDDEPHDGDPEPDDAT